MKETEYARAMKDQVWVKNSDIAAQACAPGVERKVLAFTDGLMCVENHFMEGARGAVHHHPHTQITYVVSGQFEFQIAGEKRIVNPGDSMLKKDVNNLKISRFTPEFHALYIYGICSKCKFKLQQKNGK